MKLADVAQSPFTRTKDARKGHAGLATMCRWSVLLCVAGSLALASGCADEHGDQFSAGTNAKLVAEPTTVTFSQLQPGETQSEGVVVRNAGEGNLILPVGEDGYRLEPADAPFVFTWAQDIDGNNVESIGADEEALITVTYLQPEDTGQNYSAVLHLTATNGDTAEIELNTVRPAPILQVDPDPVIFSGVAPGTVAEQDVVISNVGSADLDISRIRFVPENTIDFTVVSQLPDPETVTTLAPEESITVTIEYAPDDDLDSVDRAHLLINSNDGSGVEGERDVLVEGNGAGPVLEVEPAIVDFGAVEKNVTETRTLIARNIGEGTLEVSAIFLNFQTSADFTYDGPETLTIEEGMETTIDVSYSPSDAGSDSGALLFESNDVVRPGARVTLVGQWAGPDLVVKPKSLDFGQVAAGVSKSLTFDMFNEGILDLTINSFAEMGFPTDGSLTYALDSGETPPFTIEGNGKRRVTVTYAPLGDAPRNTSQLTVDSNDPEQPTETVDISYQGVADGECSVELLPTDLNFGLVAGGFSKRQSVVVKNVGAGPCRFNNIALQGDFTQFFYGNPFSLAQPHTVFDLAPGDTQAIEIDYAPFSGDQSEFSSGLVFYVEDVLSGTTNLTCPSASSGGGGIFPLPGSGGCSFLSGDPNCWACLVGRTGDPALAAVPGSVEFGLTTLGCSSPDTRVRVYNKGTAPIDVNDITLDPSCPASFEIVRKPMTPTTLNAGAFEEIEVKYTPSAAVPESCQLIVEGQGETLTIPLSGEGTTDENVTDIFDQVSGRKVDVLFVVDNSGSMGDEQNNLAANFQSFIQAANTWNVDFQIGVTSTDQSDEGHLQTRNGHPRIIRSAVMSASDVEAAFQDNINLGTTGSNNELGLRAAEKALSDPAITEDVPGDCPGSPNSQSCSPPYSCDTIDQSCGGHNARFLRDDASLEIIYVSDEVDQSPAAIDFYVDFFKNIKGFENDSLFHSHAIIGFDSGSGCDTSNFNRYKQVANSSGGLIEPLCGNFANALSNIGNNAFGLRVQFFLSRAPDPNTIRVTVDGMAVTSGWSYDSNSNSIVFDDPPSENSTIQVDYKAACY